MIPISYFLLDSSYKEFQNFRIELVVISPFKLNPGPSRVSKGPSAPMMSTLQQSDVSTAKSIVTSYKEVSEVAPEKSHKGAAFWLTYLAAIVSTFLFALALTGVGTALPTIIQDLNDR